MGEGVEFDLPGLPAGTDYEKFRAKARDFLRSHLNHVSLQKLRRNKPLTENGIMEPGRLYESPFTAIAPQGPDALFSTSEMDELLRALKAVRMTAVAA